MSGQNGRIIESCVYVGLGGSITACLKEENRTKTVELTMAYVEHHHTMDLNAQELSLLIEILHDMKEKQTNVKHYR